MVKRNAKLKAVWFTASVLSHGKRFRFYASNAVKNCKDTYNNGIGICHVSCTTCWETVSFTYRKWAENSPTMECDMCHEYEGILKRPRHAIVQKLMENKFLAQTRVLDLIYCIHGPIGNKLVQALCFDCAESL